MGNLSQITLPCFATTIGQQQDLVSREESFNRSLALIGHVTNASFKQWVGILLMPKIDRAHKNENENLYLVRCLIVTLRCALNVTTSSLQHYFPWSLSAILTCVQKGIIHDFKNHILVTWPATKEITHFKKMVQVWNTKSLLFCLRYDQLIVFPRQNHITFIFIKVMSHDLLEHYMAYYHTFNTFSFVRLCQNSCWTTFCCFGFIKCFADCFNIMTIYYKGVPARKIKTSIDHYHCHATKK